MAFSDFKRLGDTVKKLHITLTEREGLFEECRDVAPTDFLLQALHRGSSLASAIGTEKARSEMIVTPLLLELKTTVPHISLFSGIDLNVDAAAGLTGVCDYLLSRNAVQTMLTAPVVAVVEAKRDDIHEGLGQCIAEMVAAQRFNEQEGNDIPAVYGAVTTGTIWTFLRLRAQTVTLDLQEYHITQPGKLLGILHAMVTGSAPVA
jgi:hypothetical protein